MGVPKGSVFTRYPEGVSPAALRTDCTKAGGQEEEGASRIWQVQGSSGGRLGPEGRPVGAKEQGSGAGLLSSLLWKYDHE